MDLRSAATQAAVEYAAANDQSVGGAFRAAERALDDLLAWAGDNPVIVVAGIGIVVALIVRRPRRR